MWIAILAGFLVSVEALFTGSALGAQKRSKLFYLILVNALMIPFAFAGYFAGLWIGEVLDVDWMDYLIAGVFFSFGAWIIFYYYIFEHKKHKEAKRTGVEIQHSKKNLYVILGLIWIEIFLETVALTLTLGAIIWIPISIIAAHIIYASTMYFAGQKMQKLAGWVSPVVSGSSLIIYGFIILFIDLGELVV